MIPGSGSVIFLLFVLVTVPIITKNFLKVYRLWQQKSTNVRLLFVLFSYHYSIFIRLHGNILLKSNLFHSFLNNQNTDFPALLESLLQYMAPMHTDNLL